MIKCNVTTCTVIVVAVYIKITSRIIHTQVQNLSSSGVTFDVQKTKTYKTTFYLLLIIFCGCESLSLTVTELENIRT